MVFTIRNILINVNHEHEVHTTMYTMVINAHKSLGIPN